MSKSARYELIKKKIYKDRGNKLLLYFLKLHAIYKSMATVPYEVLKLVEIKLIYFHCFMKAQSTNHLLN